jgi:hypothetical protein
MTDTEKPARDGMTEAAERAGRAIGRCLRHGMRMLKAMEHGIRDEYSKGEQREESKGEIQETLPISSAGVQ